MLPSSLLRWLSKPSRTSRVAPRPSARPTVESLEARDVPAFLGPISYATGATAWDVQTADVNNDGDLDVLTVERSAGTLSVALGNGDGTLGAPQSFAAGATPRALAVADLDGDGNLDVVTVNEKNTLSLLRGNGDGAFQARTNIGISGGKGAKALAVEVGDMNHDGNLDLVVGALGNTYKQRGFTRQDGVIHVLTGKGDGSFRSTSTVSIVGGVPRSYLMTNPGISPVNLDLGDVNGDGNLDVVAATYQNIGGFPEDPIGDRPVYFLPGDGNGGISLTTRRINLVSGPAALSLSDFNADGRLDLAVTSNDQYGYVRVGLGNGDGTFQDSGSGNGAYETWLFDVAAIDVNQDGKVDLVAANGYGAWGISVSLGNGDGTFQDAQTFVLSSVFAALAVGDFNGDGYLDVAVIDGSSLSIFLNDQAW